MTLKEKNQFLLVGIGKNIQKIRLKNKMTQEDLSDLSGLHRTYIGSVERGERNITILNLIIIAKSLKVKAGELLNE